MLSAFVFVQVGSFANWNEAKALHDALHAVSGVKTVHFVAGPTDVVVFVEAADQAGLMEALGKIRAVKGVTSSDTRIVMPL
jgi:hypothetical protein